MFQIHDPEKDLRASIAAVQSLEVEDHNIIRKNCQGRRKFGKETKRKMIEVMFETLDSELLVFAGDFSTDGLTLQDAYRKMSTNVWWKKQDVGHIGKNNIHLISNGVTTSLAQPAGVAWKGADEQHEVRHYHVFYMHGLGPISLASS